MALNSEALSTTQNRVQSALDLMEDLTNGFVYLGIGGNEPWPQNDTQVQVPVESTDYLNQVRRQLVALKQLSVSGASLVIPRNDWVANSFVYSAYSNALAMFSTTLFKQANGTVNANATSTTIYGTNTTFQLDFLNNNFIDLPGDGISVFPQTKEVINVVNNTVMVVNSVFTSTYVGNVAYNLFNTAPKYALNWYVRNSFDQVFVCLGNNNGTISSAMPQITLGGDLPTNPFIQTSDGYLWKYLYTLSSGAKKLFFTQNWMPVLTDNNVLGAAVPGSILVVNILNGGNGYNQNIATFNAPIIAVSGDGANANITAQVNANGQIYGVNIINNGNNYTIANVTANGGDGTAVLQAVISPRGGWGANAAFQLGATTLMISTQLLDTENGTIPTVDSLGENFNYRQLSVISNPTLANSNTLANATNYNMSYQIQVAPTINEFKMNDWAYQSNNVLLNQAFWSAQIVWFNAATNTLYVNNVAGQFLAQTPIYGAINNGLSNNNPYVTTTAFNILSPNVAIFSGQDLYVENNLPIQRFPLQTEQVQLILQF